MQRVTVAHDVIVACEMLTPCGRCAAEASHEPAQQADELGARKTPNHMS
jgi:hypothetical protein